MTPISYRANLFLLMQLFQFFQFRVVQCLLLFQCLLILLRKIDHNDKDGSFIYWHPRGVVPFSEVSVTLVPAVVERRRERTREGEGKEEEEEGRREGRGGGRREGRGQGRERERREKRKEKGGKGGEGRGKGILINGLGMIS